MLGASEQMVPRPQKALSEVENEDKGSQEGDRAKLRLWEGVRDTQRRGI